MTTLEIANRFNPAVFNRSLVGFDRMFTDMEQRFTNSMAGNYPPYNIAKITEDQYEISIAVTGFEKNEIDVQIKSNVMTITGVRTPSEDQAETEYIHRGLALRDFERVFTLADHMKVITAEIKNGILSIKLEREVPEEMKPRKIEIG